MIKKFRSVISLLVLSILLAIVFKVTLFEAYTIPTPSMEPALIPGDKVIVNKLILGGRFFRNFYAVFGRGETPKISRIPGLRGVKRNDVLIFNFPYQDWGHMQMDLTVHYAKRCVAVPGDTFYIENGIYKVKGTAAGLGNVEAQMRLSSRKAEDFAPVIYDCYPQDGRHHWTIHNFGPVYVPHKGETIPVDTMNIELYRKMMTYFTGKDISVKSGQILMGDSLITGYTFPQNCYFMAGDLVSDSRDSRYWGLLPEEFIVGKVAYIWNNTNRQTRKTSWKRWFHAVK